MTFSVHLQLEYRKNKRQNKGENSESKAGLHVLIALISSALVLLKETKVMTYIDLLSGIEKRTNKYYTI